MDSLSRELDDLRRCNKRLADDKALLESQFLATEDTIFTLAKENEELKVQVKNLENVTEMKGELIFLGPRGTNQTNQKGPIIFICLLLRN